MPQSIRIWEIDGSTLKELPRPHVDLEARLEQWLESDISIISDDFLLIGRQVRTDYDGYIDLLCLDSTGDIVIIELKRGRTPREVAAQSLDYASWVKGLSSEEIVKIGNEYLGQEGPLEEAFQAKFDEELPEILNENHRAIIVAAEIDSSTERIVRYLSDAGIGINVATVQHFQTSDGKEMMAQVFLIEPAETEARVQTASRRRPRPTHEQFQNISEENGVGPLYSSMVNDLERLFDRTSRRRNGIAFRGKLGRTNRVIFNLIPTSSSKDKGLLFQIYASRMATYLGTSRDQVRNFLPPDHETWTYWPNAPEEQEDEWSGYQGYFKSMNEVQSFVTAIKQAKVQNANPQHQTSSP